MDEEAEAFVTEMENEEEVNANDGAEGQDKKNYVEEEDINVNAEEEWNEDEDVIEL